jgi:hypothetical protein
MYQGGIMIVVRNVFRLKFGRSKEAIPIWRDGLALSKRLGSGMKSARILTDIVGDFYTIVFEATFDSLADFERSAGVLMGNAEWESWYQKAVGLVESGYREIFNVVAE